MDRNIDDNAHSEGVMRKFFVLGLVCAASACGGSSVDVGGYSAPDSGASAPAPSPADAPPAGSSAKVDIHLRASTSPVAHGDGLSGETPGDQRIGIRKLTMMTSPVDPSPLVVFDLGASAVEAGLNDKNDTVIATVPASSLKAGTYTIARVAISHVRYRVAATMHAIGQSVPGVFDNVHVLTDGSIIDGQTWNKGHYRFSFEAGGAVLGSQSGENTPLPLSASSGGITMDSTAGETSYVFPIDIPVDPNVASDVKLVFEINTNENFRWQDQPAPGYAGGVFDVTPTSYESVKSFGANSFHVFAEFAVSP